MASSSNCLSSTYSECLFTWLTICSVVDAFNWPCSDLTLNKCTRWEATSSAEAPFPFKIMILRDAAAVRTRANNNFLHFHLLINRLAWFQQLVLTLKVATNLVTLSRVNVIMSVGESHAWVVELVEVGRFDVTSGNIPWRITILLMRSREWSLNTWLPPGVGLLPKEIVKLITWQDRMARSSSPISADRYWEWTDNAGRYMVSILTPAAKTILRRDVPFPPSIPVLLPGSVCMSFASYHVPRQATTC